MYSSINSCALEQPLRRDRRPPDFRVDLIGGVVQPLERIVHHRSDRPQRVAGRHQALQASVQEHFVLLTVFSSHGVPTPIKTYRTIPTCLVSEFFSDLPETAV